MKRRFLATVVAVGLLATAPTLAFAARSVTNSSGSSSSGGDSGYVPGGVSSSGTVTQGSGTTVPSTVVTPGAGAQTTQQATAVSIDAYGTQTTGASTVTTAYGTISVKTNGMTTQGTSITYNQENGNAVYGTTEVALRGNGAAVAGLSDSVRNTNNSIDAAGSMAGVVAGTAGSTNICTGLNLNTIDPATGIAIDVETEIVLKVDFLTEAMQNLLIGGYSNAGNNYVLGQVVSVDYAKKLVTVRVPGSGTYWLASR